MIIPWHRFLKIGLRQLLKGTCYDVVDEFDISNQAQRVDFVIIRKSDEDLPEPDRRKMPDGLRELADHNLVSYKSMNEPFDHYALNELIAHTVAYSKLKAESDWRKFSDTLGLIAISTRKPSTSVVAKLWHETDNQAVYEIDFSGWLVKLIVINRANEKPQNWLWHLLHGDRSRWQKGSVSAILKKLEQQFKEMGILDPEVEEVEREILSIWAHELTPQQMRQTPGGQALIEQGVEQGIEQSASRVAKRLLDSGMSVQQVAEFTELSVEQVEQLKQK